MQAAKGPDKSLSSSLSIAALLGATLLVYLQVATFEFINLDDAYYVYRNNNVRTGLALDNLLWSFTATDVGLWQPLVWVSYQVESSLFGPENPQARHLVNLLLHCCNVVLVFYLVCKLSNKRILGFLVALLFALHPQHVQSVAWISQRKDMLSALFFFACLLSYATSLRINGKNPSRKYWYGFSLILFSLALMSKPSVVALPVLLLLLDYWYAKQKDALNNFQFAKSFINKIPFVLVALVIAGVTIQLKHPGFVDSPSFEFEDLSMAVSSLIFYIKSFLIPWPLPILIETPNTISIPTLILAAFLIISLLIVAFRLRRNCPLFGLGLLWFFLMWFPVSGVVSLGQFYVADRYTYLPHIGLFISLVGLTQMYPFAEQRTKTGFITLVAVGIGVLTSYQVAYWRDAVTLFEREIDINPTSKWGYLYAGEALLAHQQTKSALSYFEKALAIDPEDAMAHEYKGNALRAMNKDDDAFQAYRLAIRKNPRRGNAYIGLAQLLLDQNDPELARAILEDGLNRLPRDNELLNQLGYLYGFVFSDEKQAVGYYERVLHNNPKDVHALHSIGVLSISMGKTEEGIAYLQKLLTVEPDNAAVKAIVKQHT